MAVSLMLYPSLFPTRPLPKTCEKCSDGVQRCWNGEPFLLTGYISFIQQCPLQIPFAPPE